MARVSSKRRPPAAHHRHHRQHTPSSAASPPRPAGPQHQDTSHSRYVEMLLSQDHIPRLHTILASFFAWILLAGFVVFPGTFTSFQESIEEDDDSFVGDSETASKILSSVDNLHLVVVASICCIVGASGMIWLYIAHRGSYVWLLNRLFLAVVGNSLAGLISTLINVYTQQNGEWSITAKITGIVEGACFVICGLLFVVYEKLLVTNLRRKHRRHMQKFQGEGLIEKMGRKSKEPALEPGSVV